MLDQLKGLVNQLHLFTGIHTAEATILEDLQNRVAKLETDHAGLSKKHDGLHTRVISLENVVGEHKRHHPPASQTYK